MRRGTMNSARRGQSLLIVLLLVLVLAGILALTLDFGFVLLSRRSMQTAVNAGALEGARNIDGQGRQNAKQIIQNVFDDDLDPSANLTTLGAGPDVSLVQRDAEDQPVLGNANGLVDLLGNRSQFVYLPNPELNLDNQPHGDLVRGSYSAEDVGIESAHVESSYYERTDFLANEDGLAFLARTRRTPARPAVANPLDREPGVSSSGGGSPLLIGHLAAFARQPLDAYDIRRDGVTIRATAIADSTPIVHVGTAESAKVFQPITYAFSEDDQQWYELVERLHDIGRVAIFIDQDPNDADVNPVDFGSIPDSDAIGYAPIVAELEGKTYVVGFRLISRNQVRLPNASPRLQDAWTILSRLSDELRNAVIARNRELADAEDFLVKSSPALVRGTR